jgi:hypothetical protein
MDHQAAHSEARTILNLHRDDLMAKENVVGVGVGFRPVEGSDEREIAIVVMVARKLPKSKLADDDLIPQNLEGIRVDVREVGKLAAQTQSRRKSD